MIYGLNSNLLHELEERTDERTWNENSVVGDIFVKMVPIAAQAAVNYLLNLMVAFLFCTELFSAGIRLVQRQLC